MHHRKTRKRDHPEGAMNTDTCASDIVSLSKVRFIFSIPDTISNAYEYSNDDILVAYDLERGSQYDVVYVAEWSVKKNRVIITDWKKRKMEVYENETLINETVTQEIIDLDANGDGKEV